MTKISISLILAYLMAGVSQVTEDLAADPLRPTVSKMFYIGATWFARPFIDAAWSNQVPRRIAFAFVEVTLPFAIITGLVWCWITAAVYLFNNVALQMIVVTILLIIGTRFVLPSLGILLSPLALIISLLIDLLFPLKNGVATANTNVAKPRPQSQQMTAAQPTEAPPAQSHEMPKKDKSDLPKQLPSADETPSKTDYYPVIARAVSSLSVNRLDARQALYDRARSALTAELQDYVPALTDAAIRREQLALDIAIRKVESDFLQRAAHKIDKSMVWDFIHQ
jgi:hypothetical protein